MRARIYRGALRIDLLHTPEQIADVVHLAASAGLTDLRVVRDEESESMAVDVGMPEGQFGSAAFAALLSLVAEVNGHDAARVLAQWRERATGFTEVAAALRPASST